ncbi:eukaryotic translation elongation factor 1 epsilon-1-like [Babylonia areolata]|uniref:eukaryotic translation elongation factor 1 epsilon-1-like n=1 Tax=Babylonia areolata TaxID=304850 RepID=UPI003FD3A8C5
MRFVFDISPKMAADGRPLRAVSDYFQFQSPYGGVSASKKDQTPTVKTKNGKTVTGFATVARHLSQAGNVPCDLNMEEQAAVDQWLEYHVTQVVHCDQGQHCAQVLQELNSYLSDKVYFVTHHPTVADIIIYHGLYDVFMKLAYQEKEKYIHLSRWFDNIQQDERIRQSLQVLPFSRTSLYS